MGMYRKKTLASDLLNSREKMTEKNLGDHRGDCDKAYMCVLTKTYSRSVSTVRSEGSVLQGFTNISMREGVYQTGRNED